MDKGLENINIICYEKGTTNLGTNPPFQLVVPSSL